MPGWYWLEMHGEFEIVKVYEYQVHPGSPVELEVAQAGRQHTSQVSDGRFFGARWFGPLTQPS